MDLGSMPETGDVVTNVGEATRRDAHMSPQIHLERLEREKDDLLREKRELEVALSEVEHWKRTETADILRRGLDKSRAIRATTDLEAKVHNRKLPIIKKKEAVEQRIHDIKRRMSDKGQHRDSANLNALLRIESLLARLVAIAEGKQR